MFTGIVEATGRVAAISKKELCLAVPAKLSTIKIGGSLAVNGACLSVVRKTAGKLYFNVVEETLRRTTLGGLKAGDSVNLERPLKYGDRLEGHFVLGHVDAVGRILEAESEKTQKSFLVGCPSALRRFIVEKGSVAVDGVSLTIGKVSPRGFWIHLIPHTLQETIAAAYRPGTRVNLEADLLTKLLLNRK